MVTKKTTKPKAKQFIVEYVKYLKKEKKLPVKQVWLYGSYAKNKQRDWSDIDVAIVSDKFKGKIDPYEFLWRNLRDIDTSRGLEPVGFHSRDFVLEDPLAFEIQENGIKIKV